MSELIRAAAKKWFYESFDCDLLEKMEEAGLIAQAEGFSISVMAELELEMESAFSAAQSELAALREELATMTTYRDNAAKKIFRMRAELTAAEQRNGLVLPSNQEVSLLVWNVHLKAQSIPGVSVFNAAEMSAAALMEMIKDLNS